MSDLSWPMYPPWNEKVGFLVKVTFWFLLMYPPPPPNQKEIFLSEVRFELADVPPWNQKKNYLVRFELAWCPPPHPGLKKIFKKWHVCFGLHSTSDDRPSDLSDQSWPKCQKGPLSHWKMKCSFLDYVQLLLIGQVIWAMKVHWNAKKKRLPKSSKKWNAHFGIMFNFWWSAKWSEQWNSIKMWKNAKIGFKNKVTFWFWEILLHVDQSVLWLHRNWYTHADS